MMVLINRVDHLLPLMTHGEIVLKAISLISADSIFNGGSFF